MASIAAAAGWNRLSPPVIRILAHSLLFGLALSIADLLFNFYLASLGYGPEIAGLMSTISRAAGMLLGVPMGLLIDRVGPQRAIIAAMLIYCGGWVMLLQVRELWALAVAQLIIGASFLLASTGVTPLLSTVTRDAERATVFGLNASAVLMIGLVGSVAGGILPTLAGGVLAVDAQDAAAYRLALASVVGLSIVAMLPLLGRMPAVEEERPVGSEALPDERVPIKRLLRFASAGFLLGLGGGAILPFQNLFFRNEFGLSDAAVGIVLAVASLGMGLGALLGPPVTRRTGLRRGAALLRLCAVGGMALMLVPALAPAVIGFFLRGLFVAASFPMNDALVMRHTPARQRGMAMSLMSVLWSGGWAVAAILSGYVQVRWGFTPVLIFAAVSYGLSAWAILSIPIPNEQARG
ncbi:MAG: MFS transporter [Oscillochloridaceae bacterium umkhey_bin13]